MGRHAGHVPDDPRRDGHGPVDVSGSLPLLHPRRLRSAGLQERRLGCHSQDRQPCRGRLDPGCGGERHDRASEALHRGVHPRRNGSAEPYRIPDILASG